MNRPWPALLALMLAVGLSRGWMIAHTVLPARDAIGFARYAAHLEEPPTAMRNADRQLSRLDVVRETVHPPGYAACVLAMSYPVRLAWDGPPAERMILAAQLVSALSAVLLVVPFYFLARRVGGPQAALLGSLAFGLAPVFVSITSDGLSDGPFLMLTLFGLWAATAAVEPSRGWLALVAGLCAGAAYLFRPEGLMALGTLGICYLTLAVRSRLSWGGAAGRYLLACVGAILIAAPYMWVIGGLTNKTTGNDLIQMMQGERDEPTWKPRVGEQTSAGGVALLGAWWSAEGDGHQPRAVWALRALASEVFKAGHYLFPVLGLWGLWLTRRRPDADPAALILATAAGLNVLILLYLASKVGYVSERHALPVACYLTIFAGPALARLARRPNQAFWAAGLITAFCLAGALKPLHSNREGHRRAGEWLAANMRPDQHVIDPFDWSAYYSGRTAWGHDRTNIHLNETYTVLDTGPNPHSRLPLLPLARNVAGHGTRVFAWPEDRPRVEVYLTGKLPWPLPWDK